VFKQVKLKYLNGFSKQELDSYKLHIYTHIIKAAKALVEATYKFSIEVENKEIKESINKLMKISDEELLSGFEKEFEDIEFIKTLKLIWNDNSIQKNI